jgi:ankyrin repeat protein
MRHLEFRSKSAVTCSFAHDKHNNTASKLLSIAIHQLLDQFPQIQERIFQYDRPYLGGRKILKFPSGKSRPAFQLWTLLHKIVKEINLDQMYLIVDGIDECTYQAQEELIEMFHSAIGEQSRLKILFSSRPDDTLRKCFSQWAARSDESFRHMSTDDKDDYIIEDINTFVRGEVSRIGKLRHFSPAERQLIIDQMTVKKSAVFLPAVLLFKAIADDERSVVEIVQEAPKELYTLYEKLLSDIPISAQQEAGQVLTLVTYCRSLLSIAEIVYLLVASTSDRLKYSSAESLDESVVERIRINISRLSTLLRVTPTDQRTSFHHISEKEYFISRAKTDQSGVQLAMPHFAHRTIAIRCLERITAKSSLPFPNPYADATIISETNQRIQKHTFLPYALQYWSYHLREATEGVESYDQDLSRVVDNFLRTWLESTFEFRRYILALCYRDGLDQKICNNITGVELLSICGLTFCLRSLLEEQSKNRGESARVKSALGYAVSQGHESTVDFLIDHFNITSLDNDTYRQIISNSSWSRHAGLLRKVLKLRKPRISELVDATLIAFRTGNRETLDAVVQDQFIFKERTSIGRTALHEFICRHSADSKIAPKIVNAVSVYFISQGIDPNAKDDFGFTALHYVCWSRDLCTEDLVRTLLAYGADPFCTNKWGQTPIHFAAQFAKDMPTIKLLLKATNYELIWAKTRGGNTPLHWAVYRNNLTRSTVCYDGLTRSEVIHSSNEEVFEFLLASGADLLARNDRGLTPAEYGRERGSKNSHILDSLGQLEGPKQTKLLYSVPSGT